LDAAVLDALNASGVACVEVVAPTPACPIDDPDVLTRTAARLAEARVRLHSVHLPYGRALDLSQTDGAAREAALAATTHNLRLAAKLGAHLAVVHPSAEPIADGERDARLDSSRRSLERLAAAAQDLDVRLAVECLPRSCLGHTAAEVLAIVGDLDPKTVGVCIDVNHLNLREPDIAAAVCLLGPRLLTLHCSENDGVDERHWLPGAPGGVIDWPAFAGALHEVGYTGPFLYEVRAPADDPAAALAAVEENFAQVIGPLLRAAPNAAVGVGA
jgi:sugar phosphate isomerase/epimerase